MHNAEIVTPDEMKFAFPSLKRIMTLKSAAKNVTEDIKCVLSLRSRVVDASLRPRSLNSPFPASGHMRFCAG